MSEENVEIAKRAAAAFDRRDIDDFAALCTPDYEWQGALLGELEGVTYRGREGIERYFQEAADTWSAFSVSADDFRDLGDRVLAIGRMQGRGRTSGVEVDAAYAMVIEFRDGRISRSRAYLDLDEAQRAAGLTA